MNKRLLFPVACILAVMVFAVSCNRKAVFGKSPVSKVIEAMTLKEKVNLLVYVDGTGTSFPISRLRIPSVALSDYPAGRNVNTRTVSLAQSWNLQFVENAAVSACAELKSAGADLLLVPQLEVANPLIWGRMTAALIRGVQSHGLGAALRLQSSDNKGYSIAVRESQPWAVMTSAVPENLSVTDSILRKEWGFEGVLMIECPHDSADSCISTIIESVRNGIVDVAFVDRNVERMLELLSRSRTKPEEPEAEPVQEPVADVRRSVIAEGMVLLKNQGVLPLDRSCDMISLYGVNSYDMYAQALRRAGYKLEPSVFAAYSRHSSEQVVPSTLVRKPYQYRADAIASYLAIITLGRVKGNDFNLTDTEKELIRDVCDAFHSKNRKVVVLLNTDTPIETESWKSQPDAILLAGQPVQLTGSAVAVILQGRVNSSGKLVEDFLTDNGRQVSYPFGYGLSYTSFSYSEPQVRFEEGNVFLSVVVTNTGTVPGKEVVQLYLEKPGSRYGKQSRELHSYGKTELLEPGQSQTFEFTLSAYDLSVQGEYKAYLSASSQDTRCQTSFSISRK